MYLNGLFCIQTINVENGHNLPMGGHGQPRYAFVLNKHLFITRQTDGRKNINNCRVTTLLIVQTSI